MKARLIYNPAAGLHATNEMIAAAADCFRESGWEMEIGISQSGEDTGSLVRQSAWDEVDAVIVAGGDGSAGRAAGELVGTTTALGVLPAGTANVWASEMGTPGMSFWRRDAIQSGAKALAAGKIQAVDIGMCGAHPFLLWAGAGLDAEIVKEMESGRRGRRAFAIPKYLATGIKKASTWKGFDVDLDVDGKSHSGHYLLTVVSNIRSYAGGLSSISPQAVLDDGVMELWLFSGDSMKRALRHAWDLLSGRHVRSEEVDYIQFRHLEMNTENGMGWQLDGEPVRSSNRVTMDVLPKALQVIVPEKSAPGLFSMPGKRLDDGLKEDD